MPATERQNILFDFLIQPRFRIWRHILFIAALVPICLSQSFFVLGNTAGVSIQTVYGFGIGFSMAIIALAYFNLYDLTPRFLLRHRYVAYVVVFSLTVFGAMALKYFVESWIMGIPRLVNGVTILDWVSNGTLYAIGIASSSVTVLLREWIKDHRQIENLESKRLKGDIDEFKNRINPQLLYATLADAAARAPSDPGQTSDILFKLSGLLRYQLYDCKREKVVLESELTSVQNYLALQQASSPVGFTYSVSTAGKLNHFIAPALFMSLVEITLRQQPLALSIEVDTDEQGVAFRCVVSGADLSMCDLSQVEQRLTLLGADFELRKTSESIMLKLC